MISALERVLDPGYLAGIVDAPTDTIRSMRAECTDLENGASYVRRLAQGRLDVMADEVARRGEGGGGDIGDLVKRLPELLSDGVRASGSGRVDQDLDPPAEIVDWFTEVLDRAVSPSLTSSVTDLDDTDLSAAVAALRNFEDELSAGRQKLHTAIDTLNGELARRLAGGEKLRSPA